MRTASDPWPVVPVVEVPVVEVPDVVGQLESTPSRPARCEQSTAVLPVQLKVELPPVSAACNPLPMLPVVEAPALGSQLDSTPSRAALPGSSGFSVAAMAIPPVPAKVESLPTRVAADPLSMVPVM